MRVAIQIQPMNYRITGRWDTGMTEIFPRRQIRLKFVSQSVVNGNNFSMSTCQHPPYINPPTDNFSTNSQSLSSDL